MTISAVVLLLVLLLTGPSLQVATQRIRNSEENQEKDFNYDPNKAKPPTFDNNARQTDKCSYTFIVPRQKNSGSICVNSMDPESLLGNTVNKQELDLLNSELQRQQEQIEALQQLIEVDGGVVNEVKLLRKESRNLNSRVTQLYMQLLHEIIRKRNNALEVSHVEKLVLNHTHEMGKLAAHYHDLVNKYQHLSALADNQSAVLVQLEEHCKLGGYSHGVLQERSHPVPPRHPVIPQSAVEMPPLSPGGYRPFHPPTITRHARRPMTNEIQSDQNSKDLPPTNPTTPSAINSFTNKHTGPFKDCLEVLESGYTTSSMHLLKPDKSNQLMQVWCDQRHDPGGWTVIQKRQDGSVNFFRNWDTYKQGFGNIDGEYWLGLENIYWLTNQGNYKLLVLLEDWTERKTFAEYASFRVESETNFYRLRLGRYRGNAGDSLTWHNGKHFTTLDKDHDVYTGNCAHYQKGGWWYNACAHSNLNGVWYRGGHYRSRYQDGVYWAEFRGGAYSLKKVIMMIRPSANTLL